MDRPERAFAREGLLVRVAPFGALALLAFALVPLPPAGAGGDVRVAQAVTAAIFVAVAILPWQRLPRWLEVLPALAYLVVVGLLRDAEGGAASAVSPLVLVPVVWVALYGTRAQLAAVVVSVAALFLIPLAFLDSAHYPGTEWERMILWTCACAMVGYTVHSLVERTRAQAARLESMVRVDELTGMPSRVAWDESVANELDRARLGGQPLSVAVLEVDAFQGFVEEKGRELSERLLRVCGSVWLAAARPGDLLAHASGSEFRLALPETSLRDAVERAEAMREGTPARQTCSIGVACWDGTETLEQLISRADEALQQARRRGRDCTVAATSGAPLGAAEVLAMGETSPVA